MRNYYIKPATLIVAQITDAVFMAGSDDGNPYAAKHQLNFGDAWEESSDYYTRYCRYIEETPADQDALFSETDDLMRELREMKEP